MKRLALACAATVLTGLLWSALAQTHQLAHARTLLPGKALSLAGLLRGQPARINQAVVGHSVSLSGAQVSQVAPDRFVVAMRASGDLPGSLTLTIDRDGRDNTIVGGNWALVVSYIEDVAATAPQHADDDHGGELLIQKGVLKGTISGGTLTLNADGTVAAVNSVQVNINSGSLNYEAVTSGGGTVDETDLQDFAGSRGGLNLSF